MRINIVKDFLYEEESYKIRGAAFEVWKTFRGIFKEKIVDRALKRELENRGLKVENQKKINIYYKDEKVGIYVPDFVINDKILIEIKAKSFLTKEDERQFWYYLMGSQYRLGFLINFGSEKLEIRRRIYDQAREKYKKISVNQRIHQRQSASIKAFTLIELIISMGILAILAGVGFINLANYKQQQDLNSAAQEIVEVLRNAQNRSLSQEATSTTGTGGSWGVYFNNPTGSGNDFYELFQGANYSNGTVVLRSNLPSNVQFDIPASGSSSTVIFSPITGLPNAALTIKISLISKPTSSSTITINTNGKIQY